MKKYTDEVIPARVKKRHTHTVCDICKRETKREGWANTEYAILETEVRIKEGTAYPENGDGTEIEYDICPKCFSEKLIPWLESQGVKTEIRKWDY